MYCTKCGQENKAEARFCAACGTPIAQRARVNASSAAASDAVARGKHSANSAASFLSRNGYKILALMIALVVIAAFVYALSISFGQATTQLAGLATLPAGLGTATYFSCAVAPISLSLLVILSLVVAMQKSSDQVIRAAYFPIIATLLICTVVIVGYVLLQNSATNDMTMALMLAFSCFVVPAAICVFASIASVVVIKFSNSKCRTGI